MLSLIIVTGVALADSYFTTWKSFSNGYGSSYRNREALTLFDDGTGVTSRCYLNYTNTSGEYPLCIIQSYLFNGQGNVMESASQGYYMGYESTASVVTPKSPNHGNYWAQGVTEVPRPYPLVDKIVETYKTNEYNYNP